MTFRILKGRAIYLTALLPLLLSGCTVIGIVAGASMDRKAQKRAIIPGWRVDSLNVGTPIVVTTTDGLQLRGIFDGLDCVSPDAYAAAYAQAITRLSTVKLPQINDTLYMSAGYGNAKCAFKGFGAGSVSLQLSGIPSPQEIPLNRITALSDTNGHRYDVSELTNLIASRRVPHVSVIKLRRDGRGTSIPVDSVAQVRFDRKTHYWVTGMIVGLAADAVVMAAILNNNRKEPAPAPPPPDTSYGGLGFGSCPYVYSFDGERYVLDSETFSGSMFEAVQRTDVDNLNYLKVVNDTCRLRLTNEQPETDHMDALSVLAVDHPNGTKVLADFDGHLHTISAPLKPLQAHDFGGADVQSLLAATDDLLWVSNPFGRNADDPEQVRDGIELEFDRPSGATSVKLAVNVRNTPWAGVMLGKVLELMGRDLPKWYDLWNTSAEARELYNRAMTREGMLEVKVWDGHDWVVRGFIWGVGAAIAKDVVVPLNLEDIQTGTLRIRLESTAGFWMVDNAAIDYSAEVPICITELSAVRATDETDRDLREPLREIDCNYFKLPERGNPVDLAFVVPAPKPDCERSYLLQCTGYYTAHVSMAGEPQTELITRFATVPGAFGRWAIQTLNRQTTMALLNNGR